MKNKYDMTLYDFAGYFKGSPYDIQHRFVCADTEKEAFEKIEAYSRRLVRNGFDKFIVIGYPTVDCEGVIA